MARRSFSCFLTGASLLLLTAMHVYAGDGGLPSIAGLQVQLTADAGTSTTVDGGGISDWSDQANGHFFFNANDALPTYVANSGGGVPAIDFTRSSGFLGDFSGTAGSVIGDATIFVVAETDSATARRCEPDKCLGWQWFSWDALPRPLFAPCEPLLELRFDPFHAPDGHTRSAAAGE